MNKMTGWTGRVLHIDLTSGETTVLAPPEELYLRFIGGRGLAGSFLRPQVKLPWDHPDMPLLLFTGPLVGTAAPTSGRSTVMSRSPLTGTIADSSVGGRLGFQLKRAGWDGIIITGKAQTPSGIEIEEERIRITNASHLSGKTTSAIFNAFADGRRSVAAIGPAAENGVAFSALMVDRHHAAGRTGIGLCFAAKNLKYLTVAGSGKVRVHDRQALLAAREDILRLTAASPVLMGRHGFSCFGTGSLYDLMDSRRMMPTDNFQRTRFEQAGEMNAHAYREAYQPEKYGCMGCHIRCKKIARSGGARGVSMPEFETMSHFTALIGNIDLHLVLTANALCNDLGLDTISTAAALACYRELAGDIDLTPCLLDLVTRIGTAADDLGRALGRGAQDFARARQHEESAMVVKGLELPAYDPRGAYGMSLAYALSTRGGCHLRAYPVSHEILRKPVATDRFTYSGKARIIKIAEDQNAVVDSLSACKFIFFAAGLEEYARAYAAVTGLAATAEDLQNAGERIYYQERIMNAGNGFTAMDDDLPQRFFTEAGSGDESLPIKPLDREAFLAARAKYYRIRGLDEQGRPTPEKITELGLR